MLKRKMHLLALLAVFALIAGACSSGDDGDDGGSDDTEETSDDGGDDGGDDAAADDGGDDGGDDGADDSGDEGGSTAEVPDNPDVGVESDVIRIGWMGDATGPTASAQAFNLTGAEAAVAWYNENGGVLGRQLELVVKDDQFSAETATTNYASLTQDDGIIAIVQMGGSQISTALMANVEEDGVPVISLPQTIDIQLDVPSAYNNIAHYGDEARVAVAYVGEQLGSVEDAVMAVVQLELPSGDEWDVYIQDALEQGGGTYAGRVLLNPGSPDYAGAVTQIQELINNDGVNYLAIHGAPSHGLGFVTEMVANGIDTPIVGIHGMAGGAIYQEGPPEAADLIRGVHSFLPATSDCETCEVIREFVAGTEWEDDIIELNFSDGWQDIMITVQAMERAAEADGELTWETMNTALKSAPFDTGGLTCEVDWTTSQHSPCAAPFEWTGDSLVAVGGFDAYSDAIVEEYGLLES
ncbi:ABC transporter substrate-binding protein [Euzebya tangerina]|uniref:ABC transporter substrate-binding protein n=1 Tax=Euzebya tangerina TaxID=591198 RepID=UPI0013C3187E|nr:ABC transporter substrate-binding protein [Euzebya tangerina]